MHMDQFRSPRRLPYVKPRPGSAARRQVILGFLAALLLASSVTPAFAGKPDHGRGGGRQQSQDQQQGPAPRAAGKRHGRSSTVRKTFASSSAIAIPATGSIDDFGPANPYPSTITVSGLKQGKITDLNLTLRGFSHDFPRDVDVLLVAPDGRNAVVMGDAGDFANTTATDLTITLDDGAAPLSNEEALTSGTFRPTNIDPGDSFVDAPPPSGTTALSTFDGSDPNGEWRLFVVDDGERDTGTLSNGYKLTITAQVKAKPHRRRHEAIARITPRSFPWITAARRLAGAPTRNRPFTHGVVPGGRLLPGGGRRER